MKDIKDIIAKSHRALCGISEREVLVPKARVAQTIRRLSGGGFHVIGTSHGKTPMKKIWFIRRGGL